MLHVIDRAGRASEVKHVVDVAAIEWIVNIDLAEFEPRFIAKMLKVRLPAGKKIVNCDDRIAVGQKRIAKMGAEEASGAGYQGARSLHEFFATFATLCRSPSAASAVTGARPML